MPNPTTAPEAGPPPGSGAQSPPRLPWWAFVVATAVALATAITVYQVLRDDGVDSVFGPDTPSLELRAGGDAAQQELLSAVFELPDRSESTLADQLQGPAVVNFFGSWCVPCITEMPEFQQVSVELDGRVQFFGIAVQDRPEDAADIVDRTGVTYGWGRDTTGELVGVAGVVQMPTTIFIDAAGTVVAAKPGAVDASGLRSLIAEHLGVDA